MSMLNKKIPIILLINLLIWTGCNRKSVSPSQSGTGIPVPAGMFANPIMDGADPWVFKKDGLYYFCQSRAGGIYVAKSQSMTKPGTFSQVWKAPASGWNRTNIWAPELHYLNGKWYIYYAAGEAGPPFIHQKSGVLESVTSDAMGAYTDKGMLYTGDDITVSGSARWAIDLTPFYLNGQLYAVWSGWEQNASTDRTPQHLYIATMSNPWTINSNRIKISSPEQPWEKGTELDLNEGPELLKNQNKAFIIYSCRESWLPAYQLAQLTLSDTLLNPMEKTNWMKKGPVFTGTSQVYGVGHVSFTTSPDNTENWMYYHSKKSTTPGWERDIRLQKFTFNTDGSPDFVTPIPVNTPIHLPSGEK
ncbi:glycoside hydrolase family 43 protein [Rhodocytophaga rosea]|nr:glycoside hydrolase family 43 protein [Rhodocytophaga rosea]